MDIIKSLNSIDVKDIKKIDITQIKEALQGKPHLLINAAVIGLSLMAASYIYNDKKNETLRLNQEIVSLKAKLVVVKEYEQLKKKYEDFKNSFPQAVSSDDLISKLSEMAVVQDVRVLSFSPAQKKSDEWGDLTTVKINVTTSSYDNLVKFINKVENAPFMIRVEKWSGQIRDEAYTYRQGDGTDAEETPIMADLEIGSYKLKND